MKNLIIITFVILLATSCKKSPSNVNSLVGKWELTGTIDGFTGAKKDLATGKGNTFIFTDNDYEKREDGILVRAGNYSIKSFQSIITKRAEKQILFDSIENGVKNYFTVKGDTLILSLDAYDAPSSIYVKASH